LIAIPSRRLESQLTAGLLHLANQIRDDLLILAL
jgi:hypothetical protein